MVMKFVIMQISMETTLTNSGLVNLRYVEMILINGSYRQIFQKIHGLDGLQRMVQIGKRKIQNGRIDQKFGGYR